MACETILKDGKTWVEVRKHVIVCFTDIVGSTSLGERLDPESLQEYLRHYFNGVSSALVKYGAVLEKFIGDAVMAVFGIPLSREDDAWRALLAAAEVHRTVAAMSAGLKEHYGEPLHVHIGVNGGEVFVSQHADGQWSVTGDAVNVAARLQQAAGADETYVGGTVQQLVGYAGRLTSVGDLEIRGRPRPVAAWRLDGLRARRTLAHLGRMEGRSDELVRLTRAADKMIAQRKGWLVTVRGKPGIGKTRLVTEFMSRYPSLTTYEIACPSFIADSTYWPLRFMLGQIADNWRAYVRTLLPGADAERVVGCISTAIGDSTVQTSLPDIVWSVRRLVEALSFDRPTAFIWDNLQWAQPTFLDFLSQLWGRLESLPIIMICVFRDDVDVLASSFMSERTVELNLSPLSDEAIHRIAEAFAFEYGRSSPGAAADYDQMGLDLPQIEASSGGNPLMLRQMLELAVSDPRMSIPVHTLFEAQLDRLAPIERLVCASAAIMGMEFWEDAARFTFDGLENSPGSWDHVIHKLAEVGVIERVLTLRESDRDHRFSHTLLMETVYRTTPMRRRSWMHERMAAWLERATFLTESERAELVARHLGRAHSMAASISMKSARTDHLATKAAIAKLTVADQCLTRGDMRSAIQLLTSAQGTLPRGDQRHCQIVRKLVDCHIAVGALDAASATLDRAAATAGDIPLWQAMEPVGRAALRLRMDPNTRVAAERVAEEAIGRFTAMAAHDALTWAYELMALSHIIGLRYSASEQALRLGVECAARSGDRWTELRMMCGLCEIAFWGPTPIGDAIRLCESALPLAKSDNQLTAPLLAITGCLAAMEGRDDDAARLLDSAREVTRELNLRRTWAALRQYGGLVMLLADRPGDAAREFASLADEAAASPSTAATARAWSARASLIAGNVTDARSTMNWPDARSHAPVDSADSYYVGLWFGVAARLAALDGDIMAARDWATRAILATDDEDKPWGAANAFVDMAFVHRVSGDDAGAERAIVAAQSRFAGRGAWRCVDLVQKWSFAQGLGDYQVLQ